MALALGFVSVDASALSLGPLKLQSTLGEPLKAEIDVSNVSAAEADGLKFNIGSPESFRKAGVAYSNTLSDVRVSLQKRPDGRFVIRLNGSRSLSDPFLDLLLEANWSSGRIVRDYTVLLDPPVSRQAQAALNPTTAQSNSRLPSRRTVQAPPPLAAATPAIAEAIVPPMPGQSPAAKSDAEPEAARAGPSLQVTTRLGDTAGAIAAAHKPANISLDQMLVALLRSNPDAFIGGNVNRMKAGALLAMPSDAEAGAAMPGKAARAVRAQSTNFGDYRRRLAENAPALRSNGPERQASGKLQANVEERNAAAASADKLKISQGAPATVAADEKIAQSRQAQATTGRAGELAKNLDDLKNLQTASGSATTPAAVASASTPTPAGAAAALAVPAAAAMPAASAVVVAPAVTPASAANVGATAAIGTASEAVTALGAAAPASAAASDSTLTAPVVSTLTTVAKPSVAAPAAPQTGIIASLLNNPLMLGAAALIGALLAFLLYRLLKRRQPESADSVFLESRMPRDSFFGVSGGEQVDTTESASASSEASHSFSHSQLDPSDVDPVAEADVYLAYGRDQQAEEILREAMVAQPERVAIPLKLLEIHAKRRDLRAFEALVHDIHDLTEGAGPEWDHALQLGRDLDPDNALYHTDDMDVASSAAHQPSNDLSAAPAQARAPERFAPSIAPVDFDTDGLAPSATPRGTPPKEAGFIDFDMPSFSKPAPQLDATDGAGENPQAVKLALARELHAIGDAEGARSLANEVAREASGELQTKARQLLTQLASS